MNNIVIKIAEALGNLVPVDPTGEEVLTAVVELKKRDELRQAGAPAGRPWIDVPGPSAPARECVAFLRSLREEGEPEKPFHETERARKACALIFQALLAGEGRFETLGVVDLSPFEAEIIASWFQGAGWAFVYPRADSSEETCGWVTVR